LICREKIQPITEPRCKICSKNLYNEQEEYCYDCNSKPHHFDQGLGIFPYDIVMKESLMKFKYHGRKEYGQFYGKMAVLHGGKWIHDWDPQVILPVPIHKKRYRKRGYNQAEVIAVRIGKYMGIPVRSDVICRTQDTAPQKELNRKQRKKNLEEAFGICEGQEAGETLPWESVLIVDDIYTTGSTIDSISKKLKRRGVKHVYFLTICIGEGY